jgi:hypothetical protein
MADIKTESQWIASTVPVPDPTKLTTDAVAKAKQEITESFKESVLALRELIYAELQRSKSVTDEIFKRIEVQFIERDKRTEQLAIASSTAIAAALQAAKEAVGAQNTANAISISKSESSTLESLRQLRELFMSDSRATNDKINDLKSRLDLGQGKDTGYASSWAIFLGGAGFLLSVLILLFKVLH